MSQKIVLAKDKMGELDLGSNPVYLNGNGARELINCGDLYALGRVGILPGYKRLVSGPMLADYTTGTVTTTNGSKTITGSGTSWTTNAWPGDIFIDAGGEYYNIYSVDSATQITLKTAYTGTGGAGQTYTIRHKVWMLAPMYISSASIQKVFDFDVEDMYNSNDRMLPIIYPAIDFDIEDAFIGDWYTPNGLASQKPIIFNDVTGTSYNNDVYESQSHSSYITPPPTGTRVVLGTYKSADGRSKYKISKYATKFRINTCIDNYTTGTVSVTYNSSVVNGTGTNWINFKNIIPGYDKFIGPNGATYSISSVNNTLQRITLIPNYAGSTVSGASYSIKSGRNYPNASSDFSWAFAERLLANLIFDAFSVMTNKTNQVPVDVPFRIGIYTDSADKPGSLIDAITGRTGSLYDDSAVVDNTTAFTSKRFNLITDTNTALSRVELDTDYWLVLETTSSTLWDYATGKSTIITAQTCDAGNGPDPAYPLDPRCSGPSLTLYKAKFYVSDGTYQGLHASGWYDASAISGGGSGCIAFVAATRDYAKLYSDVDQFNSWTTAVLDVGETPSGNATISFDLATIDTPQLTRNEDGSVYVLHWPRGTLLSGSGKGGQNLRVEVYGANDMTGITKLSQMTLTATSTAGASSVTATNAYRYYVLRFKYMAMLIASPYGVNVTRLGYAPIITGVHIAFPVAKVNAVEGAIYTLVGCGSKIYNDAQLGAATISTTEIPAGRPATYCSYQRCALWATGGQAPKYWDGLGSAVATVADMTRSDGSAGVDPPLRCDNVLIHNDKLLCFRHAAKSSYSGTSTNISATTLTDSTAAFPTTAGGLVGWRVYPDVTNFPHVFWLITSNTSTSVTVANATLTSIATTGDSYLILKNYNKVSWYSEETEPADTPSTNILIFGDEDGDILQTGISWKGRLIMICRDNVWRVSGYGPDTPWEKELVATSCGTLSPFSLVDAGERLFWWSTEGIVEFTGGYGRPEVITHHLDPEILDNINEDQRDEIVGVFYSGLCLWSYATIDSNINNRTLIFNPATRKYAIHNFGMYVPTIRTKDQTENELIYWDPVTGSICKYDVGYLHDGLSQTFSLKTAPIAATSPTEAARWIYLRCVVDSEITVDVQVYAAIGYNSSYQYVGTLIPYDTVTTGRTTVNPLDKIYICRFDGNLVAPSLSVQFTSNSITGAMFIDHVELVVDPVETDTLR